MTIFNLGYVAVFGVSYYCSGMLTQARSLQLNELERLIRVKAYLKALLTAASPSFRCSFWLLVEQVALAWRGMTYMLTPIVMTLTERSWVLAEKK